MLAGLGLIAARDQRRECRAAAWLGHDPEPFPEQALRITDRLVTDKYH
jgi:hypothetical protein